MNIINYFYWHFTDILINFTVDVIAQIKVIISIRIFSQTLELMCVDIKK